ncbi:MAG: DsbA family protein [Chloroflexi bacterium]|uniref:DsbA family protein n=1 Tax=Candidatus Chlorohelix allophototropha TaxID=3003348 RepID=A0A8T7MA88_9CHLR|nr:DsbA family protein [Chloroflexota bacterium]WJW68876.1 DsbA family protein [Chloroflexota bacterium L227-S17]
MSQPFDINQTGKLEVDFFFDVRCPFAFQGALWMQEVADVYGADMDLRWRFFSLEQINRKDESWNIWEQKPDEALSLWFFLAAAAVKNQLGNAMLGKFFLAAAALHHEQGKAINQSETILEAALKAGVDAAILQPVFDGIDTSGYDLLREDHTEAVIKYGAFGVPTIVFEEKYAMYVKILPKPSSDRALEVFQRILLTTMVDEGVYELKRPQSAAVIERMKSAFSNIRNSNPQ